MITIDNNTYNVGIIRVTRKASQKFEALGTTLDLVKHYDIRGTYYDYEVEMATSHMNVSDYDDLYEALTTPSTHTVTLPYGQSTLTFEARVNVASDSLIKSFSNLKKWRNFKDNLRGIISAEGGLNNECRNSCNLRKYTNRKYAEFNNNRNLC